MQEAKRILGRVREGKKAVVVKLAHMAALSGPYSSSTAEPFLDKLSLPSVEVTGSLELRRFNIGQSVPVITGIPQLQAIREAIAMMDRTDKEDMLARWDDYGYATYGQLKLMDTVVTAKNNISLVHATLNWIAALEFPVDSVVEPFKDQVDTTKDDHVQAVKELNLGQCFVGKSLQYGVDFLDFRENLRLHSSSIVGGLLMLRETYQAVGVINPRFHEFDAPDQKLRTARGFLPDDTSYERVISVINVGNHWAAFLVDVPSKRCYLFDPLHLDSNIRIVKKEVLNVVEKVLGLTDQLQYEVLAGCTQRDGYSCGLWCLVVLELLLFGARPSSWNDYWSDTLYDVVGYLRLRFLRKIIDLQSHFTVAE
ncbi:hypothetical protein PF004_g27806 [Phytophthora fragariae]|nr:hypothetical protein PF003_g14679 [Phytophthora fragariae]KAE9170652.1 hypothetical protein PF004_g27806 [Phytophthora fragariae]